EQIGGGGRHDQPGLLQRLAERRDALVALGLADAEVEHVVVVEVDPVGADLRQLGHRPLGGHVRPGGAAEDVHALPADGPDAERELVLGDGGEAICGHEVPSFQVAVASRSAAWRSLISCSGGPECTAAVRRGHDGGVSPPASAQAAWRAAPSATYSSGAGTSTSRPKMPGASSRMAGDLTAPPVSSTRFQLTP